MSNSYFQFKQFTVWHDKCAMKVGTDGVLLGAWTSVQHSRRILDIGTGTGLVALMLAQRSQSAITALEIDSQAAVQATENFGRSPWRDRVEVVVADFKQYRPDTQFDVIVSNPPYFVDSMKCPDNQRSIARHNNELTYDDLLRGVNVLLSPDGAFTLVIPTDAADRVKDIAQTYCLYPAQQLDVITKPGGTPKRTLITFTFTQQECRTEELLTEVARHQYSDAYAALTKEYYMKL